MDGQTELNLPKTYSAQHHPFRHKHSNINKSRLAVVNFLVALIKSQ